MVVVALFGFLAVYFACGSQKRKVPVANDCNQVAKYKYESFSGIYFGISFLLLAVPCFLCGDGTDMAEYVRFYNNWTLTNLKTLNIEPGYILLSIALQRIIKNAYIGLGIIKVLSIYFVYKALYMLKDRLNLGFAVLSYVVLLYIFNFHLLRMSLALGMIFLAMSYELIGKSRKAIFWIIVAFLFHYTSVIVLLTYCFYKILGNRLTVTKMTFFSLILLLLYGNIVPILRFFVSKIYFLSKYQTYLNSANSYTGIAQTILFIPIAYILLNLYKQGQQDRFYVLNALFGIMLFFTGSLGYFLPVISRTTYYFFFSVMMLSATTPLIKDKCVFVLGRIKINSTTLCSILYLMMQAMIIYVFNDAFASNGLTQYSLWWNK